MGEMEDNALSWIDAGEDLPRNGASRQNTTSQHGRNVWNKESLYQNSNSVPQELRFNCQLLIPYSEDTHPHLQIWINFLDLVHTCTLWRCMGIIHLPISFRCLYIDGDNGKGLEQQTKSVFFDAA